jgi:hypothetical protein
MMYNINPTHKIQGPGTRWRKFPSHSIKYHQLSLYHIVQEISTTPIKKKLNVHCTLNKLSKAQRIYVLFFTENIKMIFINTHNLYKSYYLTSHFKVTFSPTSTLINYKSFKYLSDQELNLKCNVLCLHIIWINKGEI